MYSQLPIPHFVHVRIYFVVHRDVKPRNVLISRKASSGEARALLSDFGLCRKLPNGKLSYTAASGITGTEGWIAPEMMRENNRIVSYILNTLYWLNACFKYKGVRSVCYPSDYIC